MYRLLRKTRETAPEKDEKPAWVFRENAHKLTFPLKQIIESCLAQGKFPACLKISEVIPLPKVATPGSVNDLKPFTITPIMSWKMERILIKRFVVTNYEEKFQARQHGFRVGGSTENALIQLQNDCRQFQLVGFDYVRVISFDFSKAFDKVKHKLLVEKLNGCQPSQKLIR